jgi:hypothetical protein
VGGRGAGARSVVVWLCTQLCRSGTWWWAKVGRWPLRFAFGVGINRL